MDIPWREIFVPRAPLEMFLRGTTVYLLLFAILRVAMRREVGVLGVSDLLLVVLIADAAQNALAAGYESVPDGMILVLTIVFWNFTLDWLSYRFSLLRRLVHPAPLPLVRDGQLLRRNMQREMITVEELMSQVRQHGLQDIADIKLACIEGDGKISIIKHSSDEREIPPEKRIT